MGTITPTTMLRIEDGTGSRYERAGRFFEECGLEPAERDELIAALNSGHPWNCGGGAAPLFTISAPPTSGRPDDIELPDGWTWDRVEEHRARWGISDTMVPVATAPGCVAWGTINSVRMLR